MQLGVVLARVLNSKEGNLGLSAYSSPLTTYLLTSEISPGETGPQDPSIIARFPLSTSPSYELISSGLSL